ncbi:tyrosine-type recombinase/integrase [Vibrio sp. MA40-2]|uniref:tyrosine-type recombinase/integrase n=1 Tax=Vibrio sp. MA40-2 TaxID=3391828 RepID=UPI0039A693D2
MYKREIKNIPYSGYYINSYVIIDDDEQYVAVACDFLLDMAISGVPQRTTQRSCASDLIAFFSQLHSIKNIDSTFPSDYREASESDLDAHLIGNLFQRKDLSPQSVIRHAATLNKFFKFAYEHGYMHYKIRWSPRNKLPDKFTLIDESMSRIGRQYIEKEVFEEILLPNISAKSSFKRARDELALKLGYYAGLRTHELVLKDNFSINRLKTILPKNSKISGDNHISIKGKGSKIRRLPLHPELVSSLYEFVYGHLSNKCKNHIFEDGNGNRLVDEQYGSDVFSNSVKNYLSQNRVNEGDRTSLKNKRFHSLRHTYATNAVTFCNDVDSKYNPRWAVTQWMGHATEETTEIYICYEAVKNNRFDILDTMKLSRVKFPKSLNGGNEFDS